MTFTNIRLISKIIEKYAGKAASVKWKGTGEWLEDVGESVQSASKVALDNAGQFLDGAVQGTYGVIKKDEYYTQKGLADLKESTGRTIKGIGSSLSYTITNAGITYKGLKSGNRDQALRGLKNHGKVVAVSSLAISLVDLLDGVDLVDAEEIETRNENLAGYEHPDTGIPFFEKTVDLPNGEEIQGTFPLFDSKFNVVVSEDLYLEIDSVQFNVANETLLQAIEDNPSLASGLGLSQGDIQALGDGQTPEGYIWHHNEQPGLLQLVNQEAHDQTGHTGGRSLWGGGTENR